MGFKLEAGSPRIELCSQTAGLLLEVRLKIYLCSYSVQFFLTKMSTFQRVICEYP